MLKLYLYPHAPQHVHDTISQYRNSVSFSIDGIVKHCELVGPEQAEYFYMGQYADKYAWKLHPNRFEYFKGNESRHILDIEGDWANMDIPEWLRPCMITAMNATVRERDWRVFIRPGCSMLLMDMLRREIPYRPPEKIGFYFRGQPDPHGVREKLRCALLKSGLPHSFEFTNQWNAPTHTDNPEVRKFQDEMGKWSFALCPSGTGKKMTVRFYEACAMGRIPVVVGNNDWLEERIASEFKFQTFADVPEDELMGWLNGVFMIASRPEMLRELSETARDYFNDTVRGYFRDPTEYFLGWIKRRHPLRKDD